MKKAPKSTKIIVYLRKSRIKPERGKLLQTAKPMLCISNILCKIDGSKYVYLFHNSAPNPIDSNLYLAVHMKAKDLKPPSILTEMIQKAFYCLLKL